MLSVSSINFNQKFNQKPVANTQQNPSSKLHSQPMKDTVSFSGASGINAKETEAFLAKYSDIFGDLKFHKEYSHFFSEERSLEEVGRIVGAYTTQMNTSLINIIKTAEATKEGVKRFIEQLLEHRIKYPFLVGDYTTQIGIAKHPDVLAGQVDMFSNGARVIRDNNCRLLEYIFDNGLGGNSISYKGSNYFVKPILAGRENSQLIGIGYNKLNPIE